MNLKKYSILAIDDDPDVLTAVRLLLKPEVKEITTEKNPENIPALLSKQTFDLVLLDMNFKASINTGNEGIFWLKRIKELQPDLAVIMITAYGGIDLAVRSLKEGAADFIVKPWHNEKLLSTIDEAVKSKGAAKTRSSLPINDSVIGKELLGTSEAMQDIFHKIEKIAPTDANVLILGENGTGKDLIAKAIHERSLRANKPFIKVDVGALTETLFESELFGHKKGAFTDAREDRLGRFELANNGTLFLDEIGNLSMNLQSKLLSALQSRQVTRVGSNTPTDVDIRLICATNMPLHEMVKEGKFRQDLLYRINTVEINIPPLCERIDDIPMLTTHFLNYYSKKYHKEVLSISSEAMNKLKKYPWPGNVRELQHSIERAVIMADSNTLQDSDFLFNRKGNDVSSDSLNLDEVEKSAVAKAIQLHNGNISKAAEELGLTRASLYRRMEKYGL